MSDLYFGATPSRFGENAATSTDPRELFLKRFGGLVMTTYEERNVMMGLHRTQTIDSGKEAQFPRVGRAAASYHVPGESVMATGNDTDSPADGFADESKYLSDVQKGEKVIKIDHVLQSSIFLDKLDKTMNHYDLYGPKAYEMGAVLSRTTDKNLIRTVISGARATTNDFGTAAGTPAAQISDLYLGGQILLDGVAAGNEIVTDLTTDGSATGGDQLVSGLFKAAELMDRKNVPEDQRVCLLPPNLFYKLVNENKDAINRDYNDGSNGSLAKGIVLEIAGIRIMKSNHIPNTDESAASNVHNASGVENDPFGAGGAGYGGTDFSNTAGIVFHADAVATVKMLDLAMDANYIPDRFGTLLQASYAMGHGVLRTECCYELIDTAGVVGEN